MARRKCGRRFATTKKSKLIFKIPDRRLLAFFAFFILLVLLFNMKGIWAFFTDTKHEDNYFTIITSYDITFEPNGGIGNTETQTLSFNEDTPLRENTFTNTGYSFIGWNTEADGSGTYFDDMELVNQDSFDDFQNIVLYAQWGNGVAKIGNNYYNTLQEAINAVPNDNTLTKVELLKDTQEALIVDADKNIKFDFKNHTITNKGSTNVIVNNGRIEISNGHIVSTASQGAINNNSGATLIMTGGTINITGNRQAIYNDGGYLEISGSTYLTSTCLTNRGTVQNINGGTTKIFGGTIISSTLYGVYNTATLEIGEKDGNYNSGSPIIQGANCGVYTTNNIKFYDGTIKGKTNAINVRTRITDIETNYDLLDGQETIDGENYKTLSLVSGKVVVFDPTGGVVSEASRLLNEGDPIGTLPIPENGELDFVGWFTEETNGEEVTADTIVNNSMTIYAHWVETDVVELDGVRYHHLQDAINAVPTNNTQKTLTILKDIRVNVNTAAGNNIVLDVGNHTLKNADNLALITNYGELHISNGTFISNALKNAIIDNKNNRAKLYITGGTFNAIGERQAVYNEHGYIEISGNPIMTTIAPERAAVHNLATSTMVITGGTFVSKYQQGVTNFGTLTIGEKDGSIDTSTPNMRGHTYGITNEGTLRFYDGIAKGIQGGISGTVADIETDSQIVQSTETIEGTTYITAYLENE